MRIFGLCAMLLATPLAAQEVEPMPEPAKDYASLSTTQLVIEARSLDDDSPDCEVALPLYQELNQRQPGIQALERQVLLSGLFCSNDRRDWTNSLRLIGELEAAGSDLEPGYALQIAYLAKDGDAILYRLEKALLRGNESTYRDFDVQTYWSARNTAKELGLEDEARRLAARTVRSNHFALFQPKLRETLAFDAFQFAVDDGDTEVAQTLLSEFNSPDVYQTLLIDRQYEEFWPRIEARAGPEMENVIGEFRDAKVADFEADPEDNQLLSDAAHALFYAGDYERLIAMIDRSLDRPDLESTLTEDEAWALNIKAYALDALERTQEADEVFDFLARVGDSQSWGVSFVINRASRLVGQSRWKEGLAAAQLAESIAKNFGNDYAKMLVARDQVCALHALGRSDDVGPHLQFLLENKEKRAGLAAIALLCLGREDEASALVLDALHDEGQRETMISALQPSVIELFYTPSNLPDVSDLLERRPELRAEFDKHARQLPERLWPRAAAERSRK